MATLYSETFTARPDGPLGAPWVLTGPSQLYVAGGLVTLAGAATNGYADLDLHGQANTISAEWAFMTGTPNPTVCLISHNEAQFVGANMRLHIVCTPSALEVQLRQNDGAFEDLLTPDQGGPVYEPVGGFAVGQLVGLVVGITGDTAVITAPDGSVHTVTDPRIASMGGGHVVLQVIRAAGTDPVGEWYSIDVEGTPDPMARTAVNSVPASWQSSADVFENMDLTGGTASDATNGNTTPNNGQVLLYVTASAADTLHVNRPEIGVLNIPLASGATRLLGRFEVDQYGEAIEWNAAATTKVLPVQLVEL